MHRFFAKNATEMQRCGRELGMCLECGQTVLLDGSLGSGKTEFVRGVASFFGIQDEVTSPTYCFLNEYKIDELKSIYHFDLYRLKSAEELSETGFDEFGFSPRTGFSFIEWANLFESEMPDDCLIINITGSGDEVRTLQVDAFGDKSSRVLRMWAHDE